MGLVNLAAIIDGLPSGVRASAMAKSVTGAVIMLLPMSDTPIISTTPRTGSASTKGMALSSMSKVSVCTAVPLPDTAVMAGVLGMSKLLISSRFS